jgi:glyoxylase-like metal-dependent hydrolase (beta-lactamase superfamily II)
MQVSDNVYVYLWHDQGENNCNSVFISGKAPALIDPGLLHRVPDLLERMRDDGVDPTVIKVVLCTHFHPDHFEGTAAFRDAGAKIALARQDERLLEEEGNRMFARPGVPMPDLRVDFYLKEGDLMLGKHELQVLHTPGHSPGSVSFYWPRHKILMPGDVVFMQGVGRTDLPGGNAKALRASVERLSALPVELLIPGHGQAIQGADRVRANFIYLKRLSLNLL